MHAIKTYIFALAMISSPIYAATAEDNSQTKLDVTSYIDTSYNYLASSNQFISNVYDRALDIDEDGFTLQQISLTASYLPQDGLGALVNVMLGRDAFTVTPYGINPYIGHVDVGFTYYQFFAQYQHNKYNMMMGNFASLAGYEGNDSSKNKNYSRSFLATFSQPGTHLGGRFNYNYSDKLKLVFGLNNGWDDIRDFSRDPTIEMGVAYNPVDNLNITLQGYSGEERVFSRTTLPPIGKRHLLDLVVDYNLSEHTELVLNYDFGQQKNIPLINNTFQEATWSGVAGYINQEIDNKWRISLRGEVFNDKNGYRTGVEQTLKELTFTLGYKPIKCLEIRGETRRDYSNVYAYQEKELLIPRKTQQSYAFEIVYSFLKTI